MSAKSVLYLIGAVAGFTILSTNVTQAYSVRSHVVRLTLGGKDVGSVAGVTVTRGATVEHTLRVGETIADGTRVDLRPSCRRHRKQRRQEQGYAGARRERNVHKYRPRRTPCKQRGKDVLQRGAQLAGFLPGSVGRSAHRIGSRHDVFR